MSALPDVVVVGGGVRGTSIAYFLARAGVRTMLIEKGALASGASGANVGLVNVSGKTPEHYTALSLMSADMYPAMLDELGAEVDYQREGYLQVALSDAEAAALVRHAERQSRVPGVRVDVLDARAAREIEPALSPHLVAATFCAQDGNVDPMKLTVALARAARRHGAEVLCHREVTGIRQAGGRVTAVLTREGEMATGAVVDAAGVLVPQVARMVGVEVPILPQRGQIFQTETVAPLLGRPVQALRQFRSGSIMVGTTNEFVGFDRRTTYEAGVAVIARAARVVPALARMRVVRAWAGLRPMSPDGQPIYGPVNGVSGFYVAVGHSGVTLAAVTGQVFLDLVTKGTTDLPIGPYQLDRFGPEGIEWMREPIKGAVAH
jgi:sarcosine oxidase subunit beta